MANNLKYSIEDKIRLLNEQKNSGLVMTEWCAKNNVTYGSFKNFKQTIRDYKLSHNDQIRKKPLEKIKSSEVSWISTPSITIENPTEKTCVDNPVHKSYGDMNIQYLIEIGAFKIHVPENIKPSSLKILVEVLRQCL